MDIGEKMKNRRIELGLSLEAVGDIVGVGKSTVRKWENGFIKNMGRDKIALVAKALRVTPGYLMGWEDAPAVPGLDTIPYAPPRAGNHAEQVNKHGYFIIYDTSMLPIKNAPGQAAAHPGSDYINCAAGTPNASARALSFAALGDVWPDSQRRSVAMPMPRRLQRSA